MAVMMLALALVVVMLEVALVLVVVMLAVVMLGLLVVMASALLLLSSPVDPLLVLDRFSLLSLLLDLSPLSSCWT